MLDFAYRAFHGALDLEAITYGGESGGFQTNISTTSDLIFTVRDWDAQASESALPDLKDEVDASLVGAGESGEPTLELSIPDVLGPTTYTLTEAADSGTGMAGDELSYTETVIKGTTGTIVGDHPGLLRATDPEATLDTSLWHFAIDCATLGVVTGPPSITYQLFTVNMASNGAPPSAIAVVTTPTVPDGGSAGISVSNLADPDSATVTIGIDWDDDGTDDFTSAPIAVPAAGPLPFDSFTNGAITFTFSGPAPDYRNLAVSISDGATTVDITPAVGGGGQHFEVLAPTGCPNPPKTGTDIATVWADTLQFTPATLSQDTAGFRSAPYLGQLVVQAGSGAAREFFRYDDGNPPAVAVAMTAAELGGFLTGQQAHQIEVDSTNRVIFARRAASGTVNIPSSLYVVGTGATPNIYWFNYAGAPIGSLGGTINTGTARAIAVTLAANDDVFMLDDANMLHRYVKTSAYAEAPGFPINLVPVIGDPNAALLPDRWRIHDFVQNWHNESFFILTVNGATTGDNGRMNRVLCDGTLGVGSPVAFPLHDSTAFGRGADIAIDQFDSAGLGIPQADVQMVTGCAHTAAGAPDLRVWNSELQITASLDVGATIALGYRINLAFSTNNVLTSRISNSSSPMVLYRVPPVGWL